jgi:hypothetical protein
MEDCFFASSGSKLGSDLGSRDSDRTAHSMEAALSPAALELYNSMDDDDSQFADMLMNDADFQNIIAQSQQANAATALLASRSDDDPNPEQSDEEGAEDAAEKGEGGGLVFEDVMADFEPKLTLSKKHRNSYLAFDRLDDLDLEDESIHDFVRTEYKASRSCRRQTMTMSFFICVVQV